MVFSIYAQADRKVYTELMGEHSVAENNLSSVRRVVVVGLVCNLLLAAAKFVFGFLAFSQAVIADAVHSLSDCVSDVAILVGSRYWSKPADETHQHGHLRIEILVTSFVGLLLATAGGGMIWYAVTTVNLRADILPGLPALYAVIVSIIVKEVLYHWTARRGAVLKSTPLIANAWHHRSDALSSIPAALAVIGTRVFPDIAYLDNIGALVVSVFILQAAWKIFVPSLNKLLDHGASGEDRDKIREIILATEGVTGTHKIRTRYLGGNGFQVDLHIRVDGEMTVRDGHEISSDVQKRLLEEGPDIVDVIVHLEPTR